MRVEREWLRDLAFTADGSDVGIGEPAARRFTQDSPILPDVWLSGGLEFCRDPNVRVDLLLTPHKAVTAGVLARAVRGGLEAWFAAPVDPAPAGPDDVALGPSRDSPLTKPTWTVSVNQTTVAVSLTLEELVVCLLPLSEWWQRNVMPVTKQTSKTPRATAQRTAERGWMQRMVGTIARCAIEPTRARVATAVDDEAPWVLAQVGRHAQGATVRDCRDFNRIARDTDANAAWFERWSRAATRASEMRRRTWGSDADGRSPSASFEQACLWTVGLNRQTFVAIERSIAATKADAAVRVFEITCKDLTWAIIDSGVDATHLAFTGEADPSTGLTSRVRRSFDFTRLRQLLSLDSHPTTGPSRMGDDADLEAADRQFKAMRQRLRSGRSLDWAQLEPLLDISLSKPDVYRAPKHDHGTHVAGILAARDPNDAKVRGVCPDISLYDLRVLDDRGRGEEFSIIAALQFVRYLNARADQPVIHGVNLSLSLLHDVENFACGRTPICDECDRLVASGVVVVAAAGNRGYERVLTSAGELEAYRAISITDPGNAETVITVGATHRFQPHTYGVSYFSSRGPTGDGRIKPDILGPGERVYSTVFDNSYAAKDGTSMAAPHVSGVAALLMARHREFVGQPARIKKILCDTATDLGRDRYFQGAGMVDALRALQSV